MGIINWFKGWGKAIKLINKLNNAIRTFPDNQKDLEYLINNRQEWSNNEDYNAVKKRIIQGYSTKINYENVKTLGNSYLDFFSNLFPNESNDEILSLVNKDMIESMIFEKINNDDALDPDEIQSIIEYSKDLKVSEYDTSEKIKNKFEYYVTNWELDKGIFPNLNSDFILQKNEQCIYREENVELIEQRQVTKRINYGGPSVRIKIAKGLSYNLGSYNVGMEKEIKKISRGKGVINITTNRVLFKSNEKSSTITLNSIMAIEPFNDAIVISKSNGNPITFITKNGAKTYQYLNGAIRNL
ncbi:MAG: hypothetical protein WCP69_09505 [Bacteroidota bacterium]